MRALLFGALCLSLPATAAAETDREKPPRSDRDEQSRSDPDGRGAAARELDAIDAELVDAGHKSSIMRPRSTLSGVAWGLLALPEHVVEAALFPVGWLVDVSERHAVPERVIDLLEITDRISIEPAIEAATGDGFGAGLEIKIDWGDITQREASAGGSYQLDGDFEVGAEASQRFAALEGREVGLELAFERDQSNSYFGIGPSSSGDERELGIDRLRAELASDLTRRQTFRRLSGESRLSLVRERLYPGVGSSPPVASDGDAVAPPPGFASTTNYVNAGLTLRYDLRDNDGRTSRGILAALELDASHDLDGRRFSGVSARLTSQLFIPVFNRRRTLALHAGVGVAEPMFGSDQVPLHALVTLGRKSFLRGYSRERFRAHRGWWGGVEYRYPIWYLDIKPAVITSNWFVDVGQVGNSIGEMVSEPLRYSYGFGFAVERYKSKYAGFQFGRSPEGNQLIFGVGGVL